MKKTVISSLAISMIPGLCMAMHPRIAQLIAEKQQMMKKLEDCQGTTKALKIAGISTLGLTAVGVAGNIAEAVVLNNAKEDVKKAKSDLEKEQKIKDKHDKLDAEKQESEKESAETTTSETDGANSVKCQLIKTNHSDKVADANYADGVCHLSVTDTLTEDEKAEAKIKEIFGSNCEDVKKDSEQTNIFTATCNGIKMRVGFGGISTSQEQRDSAARLNKLKEYCRDATKWAGTLEGDTCVINKTDVVDKAKIPDAIQDIVKKQNVICTGDVWHEDGNEKVWSRKCDAITVRVKFGGVKDYQDPTEIDDFQDINIWGPNDCKGTEALNRAERFLKVAYNTSLNKCKVTQCKTGRGTGEDSVQCEDTNTVYKFKFKKLNGDQGPSKNSIKEYFCNKHLDGKDCDDYSNALDKCADHVLNNNGTNSACDQSRIKTKNTNDNPENSQGGGGQLKDNPSNPVVAGLDPVVNNKKVIIDIPEIQKQ